MACYHFPIFSPSNRNGAPLKTTISVNFLYPTRPGIGLHGNDHPVKRYVPWWLTAKRGPKRAAADQLPTLPWNVASPSQVAQVALVCSPPQNAGLWGVVHL